MKINRDLVFFLILAVYSFITTWAIHQGQERFNWRSEIWADKAGYYIYLPATFFYHFDISKVPAGLDAKTGNGFVCDLSDKKIHTHFYYGEALLISPFFMATHITSRLLHWDEDGGFSEPYHRVFNFAAVFYFLLGIWFLKKFLANYLSQNISWFVILVVFAGTNLMFYTLEDTLMSHVYSFSLGSVFLYLAKKFISDMSNYKCFLMMSFVFALMFMIRPTNSIIATAFLFLDIRSFKDIMLRLKVLFRPKHIFAALLILIILSFPQLLYWRYLCGRFTIPPYGGAGFGNWDQPRLMQTWFSTVNGLFTYSPVLIFFVGGMIYMIWKRIPNGIYFMIIFLVVSYMASAWRNWYWGGAYGHRAFVDFYGLFCLPFGFLMQDLFIKLKKPLSWLLILLVVFLTYFSVHLTFSVMLKANFKSFFGSTWDFGEYSRVLCRAGFISPHSASVDYTNDYENEQQTSSRQVTDQKSHSGMYSLKASPQDLYFGNYSHFMWEFAYRYPKLATVSLWLNKPFNARSGALLVFSIEKNGTSATWQSVAVDSFNVPPDQWTKLETSFTIPEHLDGEYKMMVYIWNAKRKVLYIDDLHISFE